MSNENIGEIADMTGLNLGGSILCPKCGFDTRKTIVPISEDDKQEYMRSILGGRLFSKQYELFNGKIKVTFRDVTLAESDHILTLTAGLVGSANIVAKLMQVKIAFALVKLELDGGEIINGVDCFSVNSFTEAVEAYQKVLGKLPESVGGLIAVQFQKFLKLVNDICTEGLSSDF
jgi:hypothetical protein